MFKKVTLKKYANRRLYDTEKSRYVTLDEVSEMIKEGGIVEVRDAKTKEDVTSFILTQIILEEAKKKNVLLPVPLLHLIIQYGENLLGEFFENYLEQMIKSYINYRKEADQQFGKWLEFGTDFTDMAKKTMAFSQPFFDAFSSGQSQDREKEKDD
jgi:polyhydroxyalkanoate synthesis repressor PhaR